jgi:transposase
MGRMTLITGGERRRRWSDEDRGRILAAVEAPGAVVAEVARREDICTSLVYQWRRDARAAGGATGFAEVVVEHAPRPPIAKSAAMSDPEPSAILVEMNGARVRIGANVSAAVIAATLKALRS